VHDEGEHGEQAQTKREEDVRRLRHGWIQGQCRPCVNFLGFRGGSSAMIRLGGTPAKRAVAAGIALNRQPLSPATESGMMLAC
jgi:hypothetical protein